MDSRKVDSETIPPSKTLVVIDSQRGTLTACFAKDRLRRTRVCLPCSTVMEGGNAG